MGSLYKQIYRYTRPRAFRHNENLWPYTKITRAESGEIRTLQYKGQHVPLVSLSALKKQRAWRGFVDGDRPLHPPY
ncbi:lipopolysaccharide core biosynthesis protein RfaZ [Raoultella ornithinolytica]|nr:lipopolysaccharide core biosynthesis protein RfaZ [Raoultella ornithinolytica]